MVLPGISIIIPVYNEQAIINRQIKHLLTLEYSGPTEIIIVDGEENNSTLSAIDTRFSVRKIAAGKGRGLQMNSGARATKGDILLFVHADTGMPKDSLSLIAAKMKSEEVVAGAFQLGIDSERSGIKLIEKMANIRSRFNRIPYGDQSIFIRRDYFFKIGGFDEIPIMEDVALMRKIKNKHDPITIIPSKTKTSARRWTEEGAFYTTLRNWSLFILYSLGVSPQKLIQFYRKE